MCSGMGLNLQKEGNLSTTHQDRHRGGARPRARKAYAIGAQDPQHPRMGIARARTPQHRAGEARPANHPRTAAPRAKGTSTRHARVFLPQSGGRPVGWLPQPFG